MNQEILARTIIETFVHKFFRDMETDPDRSIRNIIDLGINFARGRFQKEFLQALQEMMQNEQSAYYDLVKNVVANTDHEKLKVFGMNLGFQACTIGANTIRENEEKWNFNIPWAYQLLFGEKGLPCIYLDQIISEGKELGTYVYVLTEKGKIQEEYIELLKKHTDCAFILLVSPEELLGELMNLLDEITNCLVLVENDPIRLPEAVDELQKHQLFYGIYEKCPEKMSEEIWSPQHLEKISETKAAFYVLMPKEPYSFRESQGRKDQTADVRNRQEYPFIVIDYISDIQAIDRIISNDSCAVAFDEEGCVYTDTGKWQDTPYNIRHKSLYEILEKVTKKR